MDSDNLSQHKLDVERNSQAMLNCCICQRLFPVQVDDAGALVFSPEGIIHVDKAGGYVCKGCRTDPEGLPYKLRRQQDIVDLLRGYPQGLSASEIARMIDVTVMCAYDYLNEMRDLRLVTASAPDSHGRRLWRLQCEY